LSINLDDFNNFNASPLQEDLLYPEPSPNTIHQYFAQKSRYSFCVQHFVLITYFDFLDILGLWGHLQVK
jgi:hypothetical protein